MTADWSRLSRRTALGAGLGAAALTGAIKIWPLVMSGQSGNRSGVDPALLVDVCERVIPKTDTPGALAARVPGFVLAAIAVGIGGAKGDELERLNSELGSNYLDLANGQRQSKLEMIDTAAFGVSPPRGGWPIIKKLIVLGYYTSEIGGSQELAYNLVPGQFTPDLPFKKGDRAWSNDWLSVIV